jgi:hypothetical protein
MNASCWMRTLGLGALALSGFMLSGRAAAGGVPQEKGQQESGRFSPDQFGAVAASPELFSSESFQFSAPVDLRAISASLPLNLGPDNSTDSLYAAVWPGPFLTPSAASASKSTLLLPINSCPSSVQVGLISACLTSPPTKFAFWNDDPDLFSLQPVQPVHRPSEDTHWRAAFLQSFGFLVVGHAFRFINDPGLRYLMYHKPFWHDYWASAGNFRMYNWSDGDDFLVNYIGHPMEGAVYGYIFLNNDPEGRMARFGKSSHYWRSRFKAMAWATVWEAYFEIGPSGCDLIAHCSFNPNHLPKGITNNTGWVDFVITPTVGLGWIIMEDAIEREFVDRIAKDSPDLKYKILRGSLAPAHTFSNLFAMKTPWFRYPEEGSFSEVYGGPLHPAERPLWKDEPRMDLGIQFITMNLPTDSESCSNCKKFYPGLGFDFNYRFTKYAYLDTGVNLFPGSGNSDELGGAQEVLAGFKLGPRINNWGLFFNLRNGFIHYDRTFASDVATVYTSAWRYAVEVGGTVEYYASHKSTLRFNAGTTLIHYLHGYADPLQPSISVLSTQYYAFRGSPYLSTGYVYRF